MSAGFPAGPYSCTVCRPLPRVEGCSAAGGPGSLAFGSRWSCASHLPPMPSRVGAVRCHQEKGVGAAGADTCAVSRGRPRKQTEGPASDGRGPGPMHTAARRHAALCHDHLCRRGVPRATCRKPPRQDPGEQPAGPSSDRIQQGGWLRGYRQRPELQRAGGARLLRLAGRRDGVTARSASFALPDAGHWPRARLSGPATIGPIGGDVSPDLSRCPVSSAGAMAAVGRRLIGAHAPSGCPG